ncbi:MAG: hypothetical protein ACXWUK_15550 [Burkholderiales bacterium]
MKALVLISLAIAATVLAPTARAAEAYPARPVRMIVPYAPGGNADIQARYMAERLTEALGAQVVVDNRAGANGLLAPAGIPKTALKRLNDAVVQILSSTAARERYAKVGAEIRYNSPGEFRALIRSELTKWATVIRAANVRVGQ